MVAKAWFLAVIGVAVIVAGIVTIATHHTSSPAAAGRPTTPGSAGARPSAPVQPPSSPTATPTAAPTHAPHSAPTPSVMPTPTPSPTPTHPAKRREPRQAKAEAKNGPITYVVKPGDNLWDIGEWFHLHGYGALYQWNRSVIGPNPALIFPGQRIIVSATGNTVMPAGGGGPS